MIMIDASPKVPVEPHRTLEIPTFSSNVSRLGFYQSRLSPQLPSFDSSTCIRPILCRSSSLENVQVCQCPHVIVADDDPFQRLYYQTLFQRSMGFERLPITREEFRIAAVSSGEELISQYQKYDECGCGNVVLIVTDYHMGKGKLNGVETIIKLRKAGYKGAIVLRTSETKETLVTERPDFDDLLKDKEITCWLDKSDHKRTKETLQKLLEGNKKWASKTLTEIHVPIHSL